MYQSRNSGRSSGSRGFGSRYHSENRRSNSGNKPFYFSRPNNRRSSNLRQGRGERIDISRFINKKVEENVVVETKIQHIFADFGFLPALNKNLEKRQYEKPTPIQDQSIKSIMSGSDLIGLANTGTGKTAAFLLPLINKVAIDRKQKVLIICPTRELAQQIDDEFRKFAFDMKIFSAVCVGGMPIYRQIQNLRRMPNFVIGTPGRLKDLAERGAIRFEFFNNLVLDEVDRMLDMGFVDEIRRIISKLPEKRQTLFFSATMPAKIQNLTRELLTNPVTVAVKTAETAKSVEQDIVRVRNESEKFSKLEDLLRQEEMKKVLIFSETKRDVDKLATDLRQRGFRADCIHGDKRQMQRQKSLAMFKNDTTRILVATDVAARGLDISDISHVINYSMPQTYDDYVHRIGRTGRGSKSGKALTFVPA